MVDSPRNSEQSNVERSGNVCIIISTSSLSSYWSYLGHRSCVNAGLVILLIFVPSFYHN